MMNEKHTNLGDVKTGLKRAHKKNDEWGVPMLESHWLNFHQMAFHFRAVPGNSDRYSNLFHRLRGMEDTYQKYLNSFDKRERLGLLMSIHNLAIDLATEIRRKIAHTNADPILPPMHDTALDIAEASLVTDAEPFKNIYTQLERD